LLSFAFIYLRLFFRIEPFQWVTADSNKKFPAASSTVVQRSRPPSLLPLSPRACSVGRPNRPTEIGIAQILDCEKQLLKNFAVGPGRRRAKSGDKATTAQFPHPRPSPIARRKRGVLPNAVWGEGGALAVGWLPQKGSLRVHTTEWIPPSLADTVGTSLAEPSRRHLRRGRWIWRRSIFRARIARR
jgi:hypothetical protein